MGVATLPGTLPVTMSSTEAAWPPELCSSTTAYAGTPRAVTASDGACPAHGNPDRAMAATVPMTARPERAALRAVRLLACRRRTGRAGRSEEHTSELQS